MTHDQIADTVQQRRRDELAGRLTERIESAVRFAEQKFWEAIAGEFPEVRSGDVDPLASHRFTQALETEVQRWFANNVDLRRPTEAQTAEVQRCLAWVSTPDTQQGTEFYRLESFGVRFADPAYDYQSQGSLADHESSNLTVTSCVFDAGENTYRDFVCVIATDGSVVDNYEKQ